MVVKLSLNSSISEIPSIGKVYQNKLAKAGIFKIEDLLYFFPFRYEDLSDKKLIAETLLNQTVTITANLWQITKFKTKTGRTIIKATIQDKSGALEVIWFNQDYLLTILKPNMLINFSGKIGLFANKKTLVNPKYEILNSKIGQPIHTERLVPIYSESIGVSSKWLRSKIFYLLKSDLLISDFFSEGLLKKEKLIDLKTALNSIHFPDKSEVIEAASRRLVFDELFLLHLNNLSSKERRGQESILHFNFEDQDLIEFERQLPFVLTDSQKKAVKEIMGDIKSEKRLNRLLQGEVGSGKTVVSCFPILSCILSGYQACLLAPTEILAKQHFQTIKKFLGERIKVELHTSSEKISTDQFDLVVGTHALLNRGINFTKLGLIVIDEQHRFGVLQRSFLKNQTQKPHFLTMTATPIPRTLALTIYGDLDISILNEVPTGRKPVKTLVVPRFKREKAYEFIKKDIRAGGQAFIICPLIETSETLVSVKSAKAEFERLKGEVFSEFSLGLLHGKLTIKEKDQVISDFKNKKIDILVSTPVVEVGIDITDATIMMVEAAERFGLSSLHQLRGRVGRGEKQSYFLVFSETQNQAVLERLKLLEKFNNGLELAEHDLGRRGPGDIFGTAQSGQFNLRLSTSVTPDLIVKSRKVAETLLEKGLSSELIEKKDSVNQKSFISD